MLTPKNFFIIAALPRSGTAWLATALNLHPEIFAFHEGYVTGQHYTSRMELAAAENKIVVDVTTNLLPAFDDVPATRIFIARDLDDCRDSAMKVMHPTAETWRAAETLAERWRTKHAPFVIFYDDLTDAEKMASVYRMLLVQFGLPTLGAGQYKLDQLATMNVQLHGLNPLYYADKKIQTQP